MKITRRCVLGWLSAGAAAFGLRQRSQAAAEPVREPGNLDCKPAQYTARDAVYAINKTGRTVVPGDLLMLDLHRVDEDQEFVYVVEYDGRQLCLPVIAETSGVPDERIRACARGVPEIG